MFAWGYLQPRTVLGAVDRLASARAGKAEREAVQATAKQEPKAQPGPARNDNSVS